ncbi:hypothetical protein AK812_SmicGene25818 [Symbiodinium microadriaticum]|uniref:Uncharacterized protein n=1 Tax=Symbiodinium microadriaticum TaxID=2951 RepID=A0A1Q9DAZ1_SYMMI|nr:hypothetical protein AK812_SmicGene25818 [Symbiodinium microadriaticum]
MEKEQLPTLVGDALDVRLLQTWAAQEEQVAEEVRIAAFGSLLRPENNMKRRGNTEEELVLASECLRHFHGCENELSSFGTGDWCIACGEGFKTCRTEDDEIEDGHSPAPSEALSEHGDEQVVKKRGWSGAKRMLGKGLKKIRGGNIARQLCSKRCKDSAAIVVGSDSVVVVVVVVVVVLVVLVVLVAGSLSKS